MSSTEALAVAALTLEEKCRLLGGASTWRTHEIRRGDEVLVPAIRMSDGPNGVRGEALGANRTPGVCIPVGIALGATWNPELVGELGSLLGVEAQRKGVHVLLAPTVNLHRTPIGGRVFECYAEDPELSARLAVAFVRGVQDHDVAVTVKHFAANDTEVDRFSVNAIVPEAALRELYLRPFEAAVTEAGAWGVMSAYNKLDGEHCAASRRLLHDILRAEWGFDGFVVSDWFGAHDTSPSARAGLNVAMPGPRTIYGEQLLAAVERGDVREADVDDLVADLLLLVERTRARELSADRPESAVDDPAERALCHRAVVDSLVLLRNERDALPLAPGARVAVIGPNAAATRIMGGGSSSLESLPAPSILEALQARLPVAPVYEPGVRIDRLPPPLGAAQLRTPDGRPGLLVEYFNGQHPTGTSAAPVAADVATSSMLRLFGSTPAGVDASSFTIRVRGEFVPEVDGPHAFSAVITGAGRVTIGGTAVLDDPDRSLPRSPLFFGNASEEQTATIDCQAGVPVAIDIVCTGRGGFLGVRLGARAVDPADLMDRAVAAAGAADVAVVVAGTNDEWETEGEDRTTIDLPGRQDELIARVAAANPNTVVVINAGSPVAMPWIDDVAAVVLAYFGGQETGPGVAAVLTGDADPGGRLPVTYPRRLEDTPAWPHYAPVAGVQRYTEGLLMGYRGFDAGGIEPLFPFGHGLSYGTSTWSPARLAAATVDVGEPVVVEVDVTNTGDRPVTEVVQVYVVRPDAVRAGRPPKELAAWTKAVVGAEERTTVTVEVPATAFRRWADTDDGPGGWVTDPGEYQLAVAASAADIRSAVSLRLT